MQFKAKGDGSSKDYIRLKDGEQAIGVFAGDPFDYKDHFKLGPCTGSGCANCAAGSKPSFKFKINFLVQENGAYVAKIFQQGWTVYEKLASLAEEYPLDKFVVKIKRKGSGKDDTMYDVVPTPDGKLSDEKLNFLKTVKLHSFKAEEPKKSEPKESGEPADFDEESDLPF